MNLPRRLVLGAMAAMAVAATAIAAADGSKLELPQGADIAVVVFEDLQCPDCARAHPQLLALTKANDVPLVIHDFPIARHAWAFPAAILARWFTSQSPELGMGFRSFVFEHQRDIGPESLREAAEAYARDRGVTLPANVDPGGALMAAVQADFDLGRSIGLEYVPLMFIVTRDAGWVEVADPSQLASAIGQMRSKLSVH
jgi:protein-disulfide isomerase